MLPASWVGAMGAVGGVPVAVYPGMGGAPGGRMEARLAAAYEELEQHCDTRRRTHCVFADCPAECGVVPGFWCRSNLQPCIQSLTALCRVHGSNDTHRTILVPLVHPGGLGSCVRRSFPKPPLPRRLSCFSDHPTRTCATTGSGLFSEGGHHGSSKFRFRRDQRSDAGPQKRAIGRDRIVRPAAGSTRLA